MAQEPGLPGQPETGPASDGNNGAQGHLPAPQDEPTGSWPPSISVPATGCSDYPAQPGLERGHYLHPHGSGLLVAIMDGYSRYVLSWRLSNTLEVDFCIEALEEALRNGQPEIFNTDQGAQFTSQAFTGLLEQHGVRVSMDGKGCYTDNLFIERLWRSLKYEEVYLKAYAGGKEARAGIGGYFDFYNLERPHQALGYQTPAEVFINGKKTATPADLVESWKPSRLAEPTEAVGPDLNSAFLLSN